MQLNGTLAQKRRAFFDKDTPHNDFSEFTVYEKKLKTLISLYFLVLLREDLHIVMLSRFEDMIR